MEPDEIERAIAEMRQEIAALANKPPTPDRLDEIASLRAEVAALRTGHGSQRSPSADGTSAPEPPPVQKVVVETPKPPQEPEPEPPKEPEGPEPKRRGWL